MGEIIGRDAEVEAVERFLSKAAAWPRVLLAEGEPGIGKTSLWLAAVGRAERAGYQVLRARPTERETAFAFAAVADLLEDIADDALPHLPAPQRQALEAALLRTAAERPTAHEGRTVAVAFLNAIRVAPRRGPLVIAVDDIQWLDAASALALGFALRRLTVEPIGALFVHRAETGRLPLDLDRAPLVDRVERLRLGPLSLGAMHRLLLERLDLTFPRPILRRIHETSRGNPFFALELGRALRDEGPRLDGGAELPVPSELEVLLRERVARLPAPTQEALVLLAAASQPTLALVEVLLGPDGLALLRPAVDDQVIETIGERVSFSHPLLASVVYGDASPARRHSVHRRLAAVVTEPEGRARHLALGADGPDETIAALLEEAAANTNWRGAPDVAAELLGRACALTPGEEHDAIRRRMLAQSEYALLAGDMARAGRLAEAALGDVPRGRSRAEALEQLGRIRLYGQDWQASIDLRLAALAEAGDDVGLRARIELGLTESLDIVRANVPEILAHARTAAECAERAGDRMRLTMALALVAKNQQRLTGRMPVELIERALALERVLALEPAAMGVPVTHRPRDNWASMLAWIDDLDQARDQFVELRHLVEERGEETPLIWILARLVPIECLLGDLAMAGRHADEGYELAVEAEQPANAAVLLADRALVDAWLGRVDACREAAARAIELAKPGGATVARRIASWAMGLAELTQARGAVAHGWLSPLVNEAKAASIGEPGELRFVPDDVEALIMAGQMTEATTLLGWYEGLASQTGRRSAIAAARRCRGLEALGLGDHATAADHFEAALSAYEDLPLPLELGRTLLALGSAQRRMQRRSAARRSLERAAEVFFRAGAAAWERRARDELGSLGGRRARPFTLTPAEARVASLVAQGLTNREVAAELFLGVRTVEAHLSRIYEKLQVRSRVELARRVEAEIVPTA